MKKALLLDTNVSSFPIYEYLLERGYDTFVVGKNPSDCLAKHAPNYINCDYSELDLLRAVISEHRFDVIVPGCNDASYISAAKINECGRFYGLDSAAVSETINNKKEFKKFSKSIQLRTPRELSKEESYSARGPIIVKPADTYSGRGVSVIHDVTKKAVDLAVESAGALSPSSRYIIEEYVNGQLYSHTGFICNRSLVADWLVIEDGSANEFTVDTSNLVHEFPGSMLDEIRQEVKKLSEALSLVDGLVHTQFIKTEDSFRILEVTRRCPGDLYSLLIEKSTGFKYAEAYTKFFLNEGFGQQDLNFKSNYILRHTLSSPGDTPFIGVQYKRALDIDLFVPTNTAGSNVAKSPFGKIGLVFIKCGSYGELMDVKKCILNRELYTLK